MDHQTHAGTSFSAAGRRTVRNPASQRGKSTRRKPKRPIFCYAHRVHIMYYIPARAPSMPGSRDAVTTSQFVTQSHSWISRAELSLAPEPIERGLRLWFLSRP